MAQARGLEDLRSAAGFHAAFAVEQDDVVGITRRIFPSVSGTLWNSGM